MKADPPGTKGNASGWRLGHIKDRVTHPELTWVESNWRVEHKRCSDGGGQAAVIAKAKADALREAGFSATDEAPQAAAPVSSLPSISSEPFTIPDELSWDHFIKNVPAWLEPYIEMDANSNPPLAISPVHPDAVGTYADDAIPWIEQVEKKELRWWQRLGLALKLQHDAEGRLLKRTAVETGPRRAGKSVGLRGLALWRMKHGPSLFGERQEIVHTGSDLAVCRKAQKEAWRWAEAEWGPKAVTRGNGKEAIESPDADVWLVRAQDATYGWDTTLALVDEGWDVKPDTVTEGLEPSLLGRQSPQLILTSTAHRRARSTMRSALLTALENTDPKILLLWWGAPPDADISDPAVWEAASPYWDEDRAEFVASMYAKALAGEEDPELDDVDPMRAFECQYANKWNLKERRQVGDPVTTEQAWAELARVAPATSPDAVAVEAWFERGVSVARAWRTQDGTVTVSVTNHATLDLAARQIAALQLRKPAIVGTSLIEHPAWKKHKVRTESASATTVAQVGELQRMLREGTLRHDDSEPLTVQVLALRVSPGVNGPRVRNTDRQDSIKSAVWAASAAATVVRRKVVVPTRYQTA
ncbi:HNH endonuclease [Nocardioides sp. NPDC006273]|uniref:HNH endonuclease n=1 Tax=Nocardioides sp. NPDC006273 TaxID=3155598 RepID=UPI0033B09EE8